MQKWRSVLGRRLKSFYRATSAKLFGITLRVLKDRTEAEKALQENYVKIWRNAGQYQANGLSPMSWLITIAGNVAIDQLRRRRSGDVAGGSGLVDTIADSQPGAEAIVMQKSDAAQLKMCLGALDPVEKYGGARRLS